MGRVANVGFIINRNANEEGISSLAGLDRGDGRDPRGSGTSGISDRVSTCTACAPSISICRTSNVGRDGYLQILILSTSELVADSGDSDRIEGCPAARMQEFDREAHRGIEMLGLIIDGVA